MAREKRQGRPIDPQWEAFARRHKGNPLLKLDPLYALPESLIDIIVGKPQPPGAPGRKRAEALHLQGVAPRFMSEAEAAFERDLARTTTGGFFQQRLFICPFVKSPLVEPDAVGDQLKVDWAETLVEGGLHPQSVKNMLAEDGRYEEMATQRAVAYVGWLVTSAGFREERNRLKAERGHHVKDEGRFPLLPYLFLNEPVGPQLQDRQANAQFMAFYHRWGLTGLLTWDLPVPLRPSLKNFIEHDTLGLGEAGVNLFIPWYLLRDGSKFQLKELVSHLQKLSNPAHLGGWLGTTARPKGKLGDTRLRNVFWLYRYQKLAWGSRYAGRPNFGAELQDSAYAQHLGLSVESVRQVRLYLQQRLTS